MLAVVDDSMKVDEKLWNRHVIDASRRLVQRRTEIVPN
jgi:hypothetical protein